MLLLCKGWLACTELADSRGVQTRYRHRIIRHSLKAVCFVVMCCYFEFATLKERPESNWALWVVKECCY